jgi:hypothetical protein
MPGAIMILRCAAMSLFALLSVALLSGNASALSVADPVAYCDQTGGSWNECGSGCGPATCDNPDPAGDGICPEECIAMCDCPEATPLWAEFMGCHPEKDCAGGEDPMLSRMAMCEADGGTWDLCGSGCGPYTCENPPPSEDDEPAACSTVCREQCLCPGGTPLWDAEQGCIAEAACGGSPEDPVAALCAATGGAMDECLSACPPDPCADEPAESVDCVAVCIIGCACPADAPHWAEVAGCQVDPDCPADSGDGDEPGEDAICDAGESWDSTLEACCPDAQLVADCACDDGSAPQETQEYNDDGCFIGTGCTCDGDDPESTDETGGCAGGGGESSLLWMLGLSVLALSLRRRTLTVQSVH